MKRIQNLIPLVKPYYTSTDPAHDWPHIGRVAATAKQIAMNLEVDISHVLAAVYCHDLINLPKDHPDRKEASTLSAKEASPLLQKSGFSEEEIVIIHKAIIEHSFSKGAKPSGLVGAVVQDADRLDALGAIGILRCTTVNTQMKSCFYDPFDPFAESRELDDKKFMIDHYFVKLFKLPEMMNTSQAKEEAIKRVAYMQDFLKQLGREIKTF